MGARLFRPTFETEISEKIKEKVDSAENVEFLSLKKLDEDFDRLYLDSRQLLRAITGNPSDELFTNISQRLNKNSKFLSKCFNKAACNRHDITDLITDRLTHHGSDSTVPSTETEPVDSYLTSTIKRTYEKLSQS